MKMLKCLTTFDPKSTKCHFQCKLNLGGWILNLLSEQKKSERAFVKNK